MAQTVLSNEHIFNFLSKIVFWVQVINVRVLLSGVRFRQNSSHTIAASATTPLPSAIIYSKQYNLGTKYSSNNESTRIEKWSLGGQS